MSLSSTTIHDPVALVEALDPHAILQELQQLERHEAALQELLRVAMARGPREQQYQQAGQLVRKAVTG